MLTKTPHVTDKALKDFAFKVMMSDFDHLKITYPGVSKAEVSFFCDQLSPKQLTDIYWMFFQTGLVQ